MEAKEVVQRAYDLFGSGDMETFFGEVIHDDITWTFPGEVGKHPLAGVHKGKENFIANMSKIPEYWKNFMVTPQAMISEGNKVFVLVKGTAEGMDTMFGHYFEVEDNQMKVMTTFDDTLTAYDAMIK